MSLPRRKAVTSVFSLVFSGGCLTTNNGDEIDREEANKKERESMFFTIKVSDNEPEVDRIVQRDAEGIASLKPLQDAIDEAKDAGVGASVNYSISRDTFQEAQSAFVTKEDREHYYRGELGVQGENTYFSILLIKEIED